MIATRHTEMFWSVITWPLIPNWSIRVTSRKAAVFSGTVFLLDERKVQFDALVAASDNMAIGAMKTLQARGLRVPTDVAVAGLTVKRKGWLLAAVDHCPASFL